MFGGRQQGGRVPERSVENYDRAVRNISNIFDGNFEEKENELKKWSNPASSTMRVGWALLNSAAIPTIDWSYNSKL